MAQLPIWYLTGNAAEGVHRRLPTLLGVFTSARKADQAGQAAEHEGWVDVQVNVVPANAKLWTKHGEDAAQAIEAQDAALNKKPEGNAAQDGGDD